MKIEARSPKAELYALAFEELLKERNALAARLSEAEASVEREKARSSGLQDTLAEAQKALRPFANLSNWAHNYDGAGLVYTGPGSNAIRGVLEVTKPPMLALRRAALALKDNEVVSTEPEVPNTDGPEERCGVCGNETYDGVCGAHPRENFIGGAAYIPAALNTDGEATG